MVAFLLLAFGVTTVTTSTVSAQASGNCPPVMTQLVNQSFESPVISNASSSQKDESLIPGWSTTATDRKIELWSSGFLGVQAAAGRQFAELNATQASALYQDVQTTPGQTLTWSLAHRARQGTDTMRVLIGTPGRTGVEVARFSDTTAGWGRHDGVYTVPAGQTVTRFAFEAVSSGSGSTSIGNFIDDISFGTPACVVAQKEVVATGSANVGDVLTYVVRLTNEGGSATDSLSLTDAIPTGTTLVAGSTSPTATLSGSTLTFQPVGAAGVPGVLEAGGTTVVTFQAKVTSAAAQTNVTNTATVTYNDGIAQSGFSTNTVTTPVNVAADLEIEKGVNANGAVLSGGTVSMTLSTTNHGPSAAAGVVVTDQLPSGFTAQTPLPSGCSVAGSLVTCTVGALANGATSTFTISLTAPTVSQATQAFNTAKVTSTTFDQHPENDTSTAGISVEPPTPANLTLAKTASPVERDSGAQASYKMTMFNAGQQSTSTTTTLSDPVPSGFTVGQISVLPVSSGVTCTQSSGTITCTIPSGFHGTSTATNDSNLVEILVAGSINPTVLDGTVLTNTAILSTGVTATASITAHAATQLMVTKALSATPEPATPAEFLVTVITAGPASAIATSFTDTFPAGASVVELPTGCTVTGQQMTCVLGDLAPGSVTTVRYQLLLPVTAATLTNQVLATSTTAFLDPANAGDSVTFVTTKHDKLALTGSAPAPLLLVGVLLLGGMLLLGAGLVAPTLAVRRNAAVALRQRQR